MGRGGFVDKGVHPVHCVLPPPLCACVCACVCLCGDLRRVMGMPEVG